jgi:hypothetical protein
MKKDNYKTIRVTIGFNCKLNDGTIKPKRAHESGWVWIDTSDFHGIKYDTPEKNKSADFGSLSDAFCQVIDTLIRHGVKLEPGKQSRLLYTAADKAWDTMRARKAA